MKSILANAISIPDDMLEVTQRRAEDLHLANSRIVASSVDRMFAFIMIVQWLAAVGAAFVITPRTWIGARSSFHVHVIAANIIGGCLALPVALLVLRRPGCPANRYVISMIQVLFSTLLIHLTGGRIETHFHIFASLAFLALYRQWQVLIPATVIVAFDHFFRGLFWPESVFGVTTQSS